MNADDILTPTIIFPRRLMRASLSGKGPNRHRLGGPLELDLIGWPKRLPRPHRLMTLHLAEPALRLGDEVPLHTVIPLVYGFEISGCRMIYEVSGFGEIRIKTVEGSRQKDWPYSGYPSMLPTVPLFFSKSEPIRWKDLEKDEDWGGLTHQDSRPNADELLVVVPPNDAYGVSLWGHWGDAEAVQVVFRINLKSLTIDVCNECT